MNSLYARNVTDAEAAAQSVAQHLTRYWDPRMRKQIVEHHRNGGAGLSELALQGVALLAQQQAERT